MAQVKRFTLPGSLSAGTDVFIAGVGLFSRGVMDVSVSDTATLAVVRSAVPAAIETGPLDNVAVPPPTPIGDPYPAYLTPAELIGSVSSGVDDVALALKAASGSVAAVVSADGALVVQKHNPVDASGGARGMTLPTGTPEGSQLSVEKTDSSTNGVTVSGSIRGSATAIVLTFQRETLLFRAGADGSWWPVAGHRTKSSMETGAALAARDTLGGLVRGRSIQGYGRSTVGTRGLGTSQPVQNNTGGTSRSAHLIGQDSTDIQLVYGNWSTVSALDVDGTVPITISAAVEWNGSIIPVTFGGRRSVVIDPGGLIIADPLGIEVPAGTVLLVRTYVSSASSWPCNGNSTGRTGAPNLEGFAAGSDLTAAGAGVITPGVAYLYQPMQILGVRSSATADLRTFGIVGDSIANGTGDSMGARGFIALALDNAGASYCSTAVPGQRASQYLAAHHRTQRLLNGATHIIAEHGTNDIFIDSTSLATLQANWLAEWTLLGRRGARVWQTTITPKTTSTDSWATVANQSLVSASAEAVRVAANTWLRAGAPVNPTTLAAVVVGTAGALVAGQAGHPLVGVLDSVSAVESGSNTGLWAAGTTADGIHPKPAAHAAMAALINVPALI